MVKQAKSQGGTKKWGKRFHLDKGDIVTFVTPANHIFGSVGEVLGYLDKNTVLVRTFGGSADEYPRAILALRSQKLDPNYQSMTEQYEYFVQSVQYRVNPKPKKKRPPVRFYRVTPEQLPGVLTGEHEVPHGHRVVLVDEEQRDESAAGLPADGTTPSDQATVVDEAVRSESTDSST